MTRSTIRPRSTSCPVPAYPPALKQVGVSGNVTLHFVVGIDGKIEPGSMQVISSTNKAFEEPAIDAIEHCVYKAAQIRGSPVRELVEQNVRFTIGG